MPRVKSNAPKAEKKGAAPVVLAKDEKGRFVTGNSGGGRPKGSRNKLGEAFIQDMYEAWLDNGPTVIKNAMEQSPGPFIRSMVSILPQEVVVKDDLSKISNEELLDILSALRSIAATDSYQPDRGRAEISDRDADTRKQLN